jgi:serine kinase of HPr protein (carbohydrate metabolism regulator)
MSASIHASAVLIGATAVLIRGPSGSGKSRLVLELLQTAGGDALPFARLVADDRVHVEASHGRLLARPAEALAGLIEVRGAGIRSVAHEPVAVVGLVVDLAHEGAARLPDREDTRVGVEGVILPRLAVAPSTAPLPVLLAWLSTRASHA